MTDKPAAGLVVDEALDDGTHRVEVDASAGGFPPTEGFVYARFTPAGLEKVELGDDDAMESLDWDIAFRRFVIRVNSGSGGPSCVTAALPNESVAFDDVDASFSDPGAVESFYDEQCKLETESSGVGSPDTLLHSFWVYPGCVAMSDQVFVLGLRDGRRVKLAVEQYYGDAEVQRACNELGTLPAGATKSGHLVLRWSDLAR
jgi:hypothetical protein